MEDEERRYKYGQFGYGKYIYPKEAFETIKAFFEEKLTHYMPNSEIKYLV
jgi:spore photoproduct lyase